MANGNGAWRDNVRLIMQIFGVVLTLLGMTLTPAIVSYIGVMRATTTLEERMRALEAHNAQLQRTIDTIDHKSDLLANTQARMDGKMENMAEIQQRARKLLADEGVEIGPPPPRRRR